MESYLEELKRELIRTHANEARYLKRAEYYTEKAKLINMEIRRIEDKIKQKEKQPEARE